MGRPFRTRLAELAFFVACITLAAWLANDFIGNAAIADRRARNACPGNLNRLANALTRYQNEHDGKQPSDAALLLPYLGRDAFVYHSSYTCRFGADKAAGDTPICWDVAPHNASRRALRWKNRPYRNVLYADGRVAVLTEAEFQKMRLVGETLTSRLPDD